MSSPSVMLWGEVGEDGIIDSTTLELLGVGRKLADALGAELSAALIGERINQVAEEVTVFGADKVYKIEGPQFKDFKADLWVKALEKLCGELNPKILLMGHTAAAQDVAPRLAFRLNTVLTTDCIDLAIDQKDGLLLRTKPVYGGNVIAVFKNKAEPQFVTLRPKVVEPAELSNLKGKVIDFDPSIDESMVQIESLKKVKDEVTIRLDNASAIVAGGRGIGGAEGFKELEKVADLLKKCFEKVEIGSSRPPVDVGWISSPHQVGLTGQKVSPKLYIAVGISGAIQHLAGITKAKKIVAINKDKKASIFTVADYGVVADYKDFLPSFKKKLAELLCKG